MSQPYVSVFIPVYNGAKEVPEVLDALFSQTCPFEYEVIIIDSGSKDNSVELLKKYPKVRLYQIPNSEYNHGGTRNLGIEYALGKYVALLTQDAKPADDSWLVNMIRPMEEDEAVVAVFGKHIPRPHHNPFVKRDIEGHFSCYQTEKGYLVHSMKEPAFLNEGLRNFFSDVNSCIRKSYWEQHPYQKVDYCEDQLFGKEVIEAGYKKAYSADGAVVHSHDYPLHEFLKRYFDEYRGLKITLGYKDQVNFFTLLPYSLYAWIHEIKYIRAQKYTLFEKIKWCHHAWWMSFLRRLGAILGGNHEKVPAFIYSSLSLEKKKK